MAYSGLYRGLVVDNIDPQQRMRLRVNVPSTGAQMAWAEACLPAGPSATGNAHANSASALPPVGSGVWVAFEGGDSNFPVWVGRRPT